MDRIESVILQNLIFNDEYIRKVIPYIKSNYFANKVENQIYNFINDFLLKYNKPPIINVLKIISTKIIKNPEILEEIINQLDMFENSFQTYDMQWLLDETEKWCQERSLYNAAVDTLEILENKNSKKQKGSIPQIFQDALAVSFNPSVGHDYLEDSEERWDYYHKEENKFPFDIEWLNTITNGGIPPKTLNLILAGTNVGKANPLDSKIYTIQGIKNFGDLKIGDEIFGSNGKPTTVLNIFPQGKKDIYEIKFSDGRKAQSCKEHLWKYTERGENKWKINTLENIMNLNYDIYIPLCNEVEYPKKDLYIHPYILGVLIGDGSLTQSMIAFTNNDAELIEKVRLLLPIEYILSKNKNTYKIINKNYGKKLWKKENISSSTWYKKGNRTTSQKFNNVLKELNLKGKFSYEKHIPSEYLFSSIDDRYELLQGLLDTDGYVTKTGTVLFYTTSEKLADDMILLVRSLGGTASKKIDGTSYKKNGIVKKCRDIFTIKIRIFNKDRNLFFLNRKQKRVSIKKNPKLKIESIKYLESKECQCITVSAEDHLYLIEDYIVTHNTLVLCYLSAWYLLQGLNVFYATMEISREQISKRIDANLFDIDLEKIQDLTKEKYMNTINTIKQRTHGKLIVEEYPTGGANIIHFKASLNELFFKKNFKPHIIMVDYLGICASARLKPSSGMYELGKSVAEELRGLAIETDTRMWSAVQYNRGGYGSHSAKLSDVGESFAIVQTADFCVGLTTNEDLEQVNQYLATQLKNRYGDVTKYKNHLVGVDRPKQKIYDIDNDIDDNEKKDDIIKENNDLIEKFKKFKISEEEK